MGDKSGGVKSVGKKSAGKKSNLWPMMGEKYLGESLRVQVCG